MSETLQFERWEGNHARLQCVWNDELRFSPTRITPEHGRIVRDYAQSFRRATMEILGPHWLHATAVFLVLNAVVWGVTH